MSKAREFIDMLEQQGRGGVPAGTGGTDSCTCSNSECSEYKKPVPHERGIPCNELLCKECGESLTGIDTVGSKV